MCVCVCVCEHMFTAVGRQLNKGWPPAVVKAAKLDRERRKGGALSESPMDTPGGLCSDRADSERTPSKHRPQQPAESPNRQLDRQLPTLKSR